MSRYDDIINLPHHVSTNRPRMSMHDRAAQFAPFAALVGYDDAVAESASLTESRPGLARRQSQRSWTSQKLLFELTGSGKRKQSDISTRAILASRIEKHSNIRKKRIWWRTICTYARNPRKNCAVISASEIFCGATLKLSENTAKSRKTQHHCFRMISINISTVKLPVLKNCTLSADWYRRIEHGLDYSPVL